jgi:hypothetical protein
MNVKRGARKCAKLFAGLSAAAMLFIAGCGGGGGGGSGGSNSNNSTIPVGIYSGTGTFSGYDTVNGYTSGFSTSPYVLAFVSNTGNYTMLSYTTGSPNVIDQINIGSGSALNGSFTSGNNQEVSLYSTYSSYSLYYPIYDNQGGTLSASYTLNLNLVGQITYAGTQQASLTLPLGFVVGSATPNANLTTIAKAYTGAFYSSVPGYAQLGTTVAASTFTITSAGVLSGTVAPSSLCNSVGGACTHISPTVSGTITPSPDLNAYDVSISFTNGTDAVPAAWTGKTFTGIGYFQSGTFIFAAVAPDNTAIAFSN